MKVFSVEVKRKLFDFDRLMRFFRRRKKKNFDDEIIIGKTDNKAIVSICKECECFPHVPHLNYYDRKEKRSYTLNLLKAQMVDHCYLLDLDQRVDLEYFLSKYNEDEKMINWDVAVKTWNSLNYEVKIPDNLHRPYYINIQEEQDNYVISTWANRKGLPDGMNIYCDEDIEAKKHFHIKLPDSCNVAIYFDKAEYLEPLSRKLTDEEIEILIKYLNQNVDEDCFRGAWKNKTNWNYLKGAWNQENTGGNWCYYQEKEKLSEDLEMPDYRLLNE